MLKAFITPANAVASAFSFMQSSLTGKLSVAGMPMSVSFELTNTCNLNCPECITGSGRMSRGKGFMDPELFGRIIRELKPYIFYLSLYFQGEPMLHPEFFSILGRCRGISTTVSTNGHFLSEENSEELAKSDLKKLVVSLDGMDQGTYSLYRVNGDLGRVKKGIENMVSAIRKCRSKLKLEIQFLVNSFNEKQIHEAARYSRTMNARLKLKSMQISESEDYEKWLPSIEKYRRYKLRNGEYVIKSSLPNRCARLWFNPVITWDGKVLPCCFDKDGEYIMGDLNEDSFGEIWNGPKYRSFRKSILTGRKMIGICRNCTSGLRGAAV